MNIRHELRKLRYILTCWVGRRDMPRPDTQPIDVVIPIISKDLDMLPLCLEGVRSCVSHPIAQVYIVAPDRPEIRDFCLAHDLVFVDEASVLGFAPRDIGLDFRFPDGRVVHRSGWFFQQLIKLSGAVGTCEHYLCIDADHILVSPHTFLTEDGRTVFYMSHEMHEPYYRNIRSFFPQLALADLSYVDHKMLFSKRQLQVLHRSLEAATGKPWVQAILDGYDRTQVSGFSEFELYGNFMPEAQKLLLPWRQKLLRRHQLADYSALRKAWGGRRLSLTFPEYRK